MDLTVDVPAARAGNGLFLYRGACELCGSNEPSILISRPFTHPSVWDFIESYYEGRVPKDRFGDTPYQVARCARCGFLWQTYILSDADMPKLYGRWISASHSLDKK